MKTYIIAFLTITLVLFFGLCSVYASEVAIPYEFTAGERAVAAEVNENFDAVETGVNDNDSRIAVLEAMITALQNENDALSARLSAVESNTVLALDNVLTMGTDDSGYNRALFTGVNVQVVNGSDSTDGIVNGTGNLIVGYNELQEGGNDFRTGSHNIISGSFNDYSSYGGLVVGTYNDILEIYSSVIGGYYNEARGEYSSVIGGYYNDTSGQCSSVSGGGFNTASETCSSVSGGYDNTASGIYSNVSGGDDNTASGTYSSVSGGSNGTAGGSYDWRAGTLWEDD